MRIVGIILLGLVGLIGLAMSLCGGMVLLSAGALTHWDNVLSLLALGSFAVGVLLCFVVWRALTR